MSTIDYGNILKTKWNICKAKIFDLTTLIARTDTWTMSI